MSRRNANGEPPAGGDNLRVWLSFLCFFALIASTSILRGSRDSLALEGGPERTRQLLGIVFWVMLGATPVFGFLAGRLRKRLVAPAVYLFFLLNILAFSVALGRDLLPRQQLAAWFFVWQAVFNLFAVSLFWIVMVDLFSLQDGVRLFGVIAAGGTLGGLAAPALASVLATRLDPSGLLLVAFAFLSLALVTLLLLHGLFRRAGRDDLDTKVPPGAWAGLQAIARSPYARSIALWVLLGNVLTTFLYLQQQQLLRAASLSHHERTALLFRIDATVNCAAVLLQLLFSSRILKRFGVGFTAGVQCVAAAVGFAAFAAAPSLSAAIWAQGAVRAASFGLSLPARHLFFGVLTPEEKYKTQATVDTLVARGGDASGGWLHALLSGAGFDRVGLAIVGGVASVAWFASALGIGRTFRHHDPTFHMGRERNEQAPLDDLRQPLAR